MTLVRLSKQNIYNDVSQNLNKDSNVNSFHARELLMAYIYIYQTYQLSLYSPYN